MPATIRQPSRSCCTGRRGGAGDWVKAIESSSYTAQRAICSGCAVRESRLAYALADKGLVGMWGGTTERERREMRRAVA
jgi:hypothetical protein